MTAIKQRTIRAVAYIRISDLGGRTEEELISDKAQLHEIQQHARRFGYEIVEVVPDIDKSGRNFSKRQVARIIEMAKNKEIEVVLLWKWSRWGRNTRQSLTYIAQLEEVGGRVEAATEHFDTKTAYGKFSRGFFLLLAELYSDQMGETWQETHEYRRRLGLPHTAAPRFGYVYDKEADPFPVYRVNEEVAPILRSAYERYVAGTVSMRGICTEWNAAGIKTVAGRPWSDNAVRIVLDTGFAAGLIRERSEQPREGQPNSKKLGNFDVWRTGSHDPIIDMEVWEAYKLKREKAAAVAPHLSVPKHALTGLLFCPLCGSTLKTHRTGPGNMYHQWICRNGQRTRGLHQPLGISDKRAMKAVLAWLAENAEGGDSVVADAQRIVEQRTATENEVKDLETRLAGARARFTRLQDGWLNGDFERPFFEKRKAELSEEISGLTEKVSMSAARDVRARVRPEIAEIKDVAVRLSSYEPTLQRAALGSLISGTIAVSSSELLVVPAWV